VSFPRTSRPRWTPASAYADRANGPAALDGRTKPSVLFPIANTFSHIKKGGGFPPCSRSNPMSLDYFFSEQHAVVGSMVQRLCDEEHRARVADAAGSRRVPRERVGMSRCPDELRFSRLYPYPRTRERFSTGTPADGLLTSQSAFRWLGSSAATSNAVCSSARNLGSAVNGEYLPVNAGVLVAGQWAACRGLRAPPVPQEGSRRD
jgi:hypothetical protein